MISVLLAAGECTAVAMIAVALLRIVQILFRRGRRADGPPAPDPAAVTAAVAVAMHTITGALGPVREAAQGERLRLEEAGFSPGMAEHMATEVYRQAVRGFKVRIDINLGGDPFRGTEDPAVPPPG